MKRRQRARYLLTAAVLFIVAAGTVITLNLSTSPDAPPGASDMIVYKHPQCGCCTAWTRYIQDAGFDVTVRSETDTRRRWARHDVPQPLGSCHTALIDGYIIEGHVPVEDIRRLLKERPDAAGLVLPGMPIGSPGMEGQNPEAFDVLLLRHDGGTEVYAHHEPENRSEGS